MKLGKGMSRASDGPDTLQSRGTGVPVLQNASVKASIKDGSLDVMNTIIFTAYFKNSISHIIIHPKNIQFMERVALLLLS